MRAFRMRACAAVFTAALALALVPPAHAGVTNPDISLIGQPLIRWTDAFGDPGRKRFVLDPGETEVMLDAPLNPYARGAAVLSFGDGGVDVEEAYFTLLRGLPGGLALKGGKYRVGFGKLNPMHPHAYPFADRPHVLAAYLPGEESFDDTGLQLSEQLALPHDIALMASADWLQGDEFHTSVSDTLSAQPRPAGLGRLSAFVPIGDRSGLELGSSYTQGTNDVAAATRTSLIGGDAKLKYWTGPNGYVLAQAEWIGLKRDGADLRSGGYAYVDWNPSARYDAGVSYERYQDPAAGGANASGFGAFAGLALMEETTSFRIGWERFQPANAGGPDPDAVNTITLRVLYSMGPHKAHQF